jgi:crossover junction endodeoxyribonuclease RuvC
MSCVLGIDIGITNNGVAIYHLEEKRFIYQNTIVASQSKLEEKLVFIEEEFLWLVQEFPITHSAYEHPVLRSGKNVQSINCALGVILLVLCRKKIPIKPFTPFAIKEAVTGSKKASKKEVTGAVLASQSSFNKVDSHHSADAMACVMTFLSVFST